MLKFLIILAIIAYLLYKIGSFFFRAGAAAQELRNFQKQQPKDFGAGKQKAASTQKKSKFNDGEYIDYEEVK